MRARHTLLATTCAVLAVARVESDAAITPEMLCDNTGGCDIRLPRQLMQGSSLVGVLQEIQDRLDALGRDVERLYFAPGVNVHDFFERRKELLTLRGREAASPQPLPSPWDLSGAPSTRVPPTELYGKMYAPEARPRPSPSESSDTTQMFLRIPEEDEEVLIAAQ